MAHREHGVGRYQGTQTAKLPEGFKEFLSLEFANEEALLVPIEQEDQLVRYDGPEIPLSILSRDRASEERELRHRVKKKVTKRVRAEMAEMARIDEQANATRQARERAARNRKIAVWSAIVAAVVLCVWIISRLTGPPGHPTFTAKSNVDCADKVALALSSNDPVDGAWHCMDTNTEGIWSTITGGGNDAALSHYVQDHHSQADSLAFVGTADDVVDGIPYSGASSAKSEKNWYAFLAKLHDHGTFPDDPRQIIYLAVNASGDVSQIDQGVCEKSLGGSIDCSRALATLQSP